MPFEETFIILIVMKYDSETGEFIFDARWVCIWKTNLFILPVELDSENSIATKPSEATTTTYPEEESSELESEATDNDELPKNDRGMLEFCQITLL